MILLDPEYSISQITLAKFSVSVVRDLCISPLAPLLRGELF
jgi:hypothetical protein